jgi:hypothetical protein
VFLKKIVHQPQAIRFHLYIKVSNNKTCTRQLELTTFFFFLIRNQPFAPADLRNALELTQNDTAYHLHEDAEPGIPSIRRTLLKGWKDVDTFTRDSY